jgi:hypothetical protein
LLPSESEKHNIVWHRFVPQRSNQKIATEEACVDYRNLGRSGLKVSPLCLGTMMFGGAADEPTAQRIIAKAREAGVNFIDSADAYNGGRSAPAPNHVRYSR